MTEIKLIKGPVNDDVIKIITQLYGQADSKYKDPEFCKKVFNLNQTQYSYHAIAYANNKAVGHISAIPIVVSGNGQTELSAKAEAFFIEKEYRGVDYEGFPIGLVMPKMLYDFVLSQGIKVIHLMAAPDIMKIHKFAGCKVLAQANENCLLYLSMKPNISLKFKLINTAILPYHLFMLLLSGVLVNSNLPVVETKTVFFENNPMPLNKWTIDTESYIKWSISRNLATIYKWGQNNFVVYRKNIENRGNAEILYMQITNYDSGQVKAVIRKLILMSLKNNASRFKFSSLAIPATIYHNFKNDLKTFGFLCHEHCMLMGVRSNDSFYANPQNMQCSQLFLSMY